MSQLPDAARLAFEQGYDEPLPHALPYHLAEHRAQVVWETMDDDLEGAVEVALEGMAVKPKRIVPMMAKWIEAGRPERAIHLLAIALGQGTTEGERRRRRKVYAVAVAMALLGLAGVSAVIATALRVWGVL